MYFLERVASVDLNYDTFLVTIKPNSLYTAQTCALLFKSGEPWSAQISPVFLEYVQKGGDSYVSNIISVESRCSQQLNTALSEA